MTRPTARVLALLEVLQSGGTRTVGDLATRLGVDERTIRRYAAHLIDLGIPVRSVRGRYGGYRLEAGFRMPPLMLTEDEALAVLLGLVAGRRAGLAPVSVAAGESAAAKVARVLPEVLRGRLDALLASVDFTAGSPAVVELDTVILLLLAEALRDRRPVAVTYASADGRRSERTLHPYGIVAHAGRWYLTAADSSSGQTRAFRVDRIATAELLEGRFVVPGEVDPPAQVLSGIAGAPRRHAVCLRVHGAVADIRARFPPGIATVDDAADDEGWVGVRLQVERLDWVPTVLAGLDLQFAVEGPDALRDHLRSLAARLNAAADARAG